MDVKKDNQEQEQEQQRFFLEKSGVLNINDLTSLTKLNLPRCNLSSLPSRMPTLLPNLSILFCPQNNFKELPALIGECQNLQMVSFKENGMTKIHPESLQPQLRWLILTGNSIQSIPETIERCHKLQKLMLSGNSLKEIPHGISKLKNLELIRLACNELQEPPVELLRLPNLRWVALSRNPFLQNIMKKRQPETLDVLDDDTLEDSKWPILGEGAGGTTRKVTWKDTIVAVKTYVGELTSDGSPQDEKSISVAAASLKDTSLIHLLGETKVSGSLVMEYLEGYEALAGPPSMETCSRDVYGMRALTPTFAWKILENLLRALMRLHLEKAVCHGDFYGHNILIAPQTESVKLSDFGAAFFYDSNSEYGQLLQKVELRAFSVLVEELYALVSKGFGKEDTKKWNDLLLLCRSHQRSFGEIGGIFGS